MDVIGVIVGVSPIEKKTIDEYSVDNINILQEVRYQSSSYNDAKLL